MKQIELRSSDVISKFKKKNAWNARRQRQLCQSSEFGGQNKVTSNIWINKAIITTAEA